MYSIVVLKKGVPDCFHPIATSDKEQAFERFESVLKSSFKSLFEYIIVCKHLLQRTNETVDAANVTFIRNIYCFDRYKKIYVSQDVIKCEDTRQKLVVYMTGCKDHFLQRWYESMSKVLYSLDEED
jgi:hypothetical protein